MLPTVTPGSRLPRSPLWPRGLALLALLGGLASAAPAAAKVFHSREGAFKLAFPRADRVRRKHVFVTAKQRAAVQKACRCSSPAKLLTIYVGEKGGSTLGYAYIDTHRVRTLPETFMVVFGPKGAIRAVHILAFHEPPEYMPRGRWLGQFRGRRPATLGKGVAAIAGATLSANAINGAVRRIAATHRVLGLTGASTMKTAAAGAGGAGRRR
jgi:hypothetical protein